jgi:hypothetical protein
MTTFITFHVDFSKKTADRIAKSETNWKNLVLYNLRRADEFFDRSLMIDLLFRSTSIFHPDSKRVVLTDHATEFSNLKNSVDIQRFSIDPTRITFSKLVAQINYLEDFDFSSSVVLLDSDILINSNLDDVFEKDFDVAVTYREYHKEMPINAAVILLKRGKKQQALDFLQTLYCCYRDKYPDDAWFGDQYALIDTIGQENYLQRCSDIVNANGIKVLLLPCDLYNFSPDDAAPAIRFSSIALELKDKKVIHFKGERKKLMTVYWQAYLAFHEQPGIKTFVKAFQSKLAIFSHVPAEFYMSTSLRVLRALKNPKLVFRKMMGNS